MLFFRKKQKSPIKLDGYGINFVYRTDEYHKAPSVRIRFRRIPKSLKRVGVKFTLIIMKKMEKYGLVDLEANELNVINGGGLGLAIAVLGASIYVYNNWDDFVYGLKEGFESTQ